MMAMEEGWWKLQPKKLNRRFRFFRHDFRHPSRVLRWLWWAGGGRSVWVTEYWKLRLKKSNRCFRFFRAWFSSPSFLHQQFWEFKILKNVQRRHNIANSRILQLWWGKLGDENRGWKNRKRQFNFFGRDFHHPIFPHRSRRTIELVSLSNTFENLFSIFSAMVFVIQFAPIAVAGPSNSRLWWEGVWITKIAAKKKSKITKAAGFFFEVYQHLAEPDDEADQPCLTR